ncbi:MAG TPA: glycosyltransferase family 39 protein [Minicystis sp.]|nr:glycosyltransferase family 39 protein [Minicystis sp.]
MSDLGPAADEHAPTDEGGEDEQDALLPDGNPLRIARGGALLATGALVAFVLMTVKAQLRFGVPLGALAVFVATAGVLDLLGTFDDADELVAGRATLRELTRPLALTAGGLFGLWASVSLAVEGWFTPVERALHVPAVATAGVLVTGTFLVAVVGGFRVGEALGCWAPEPDGTHRPLLRRHGFWLVVAMTLVYLPLLGSHSLSDPWETHYGEVSREILSRNDWISLWWAQDGWFWSKPVLDFWVQALAMATFGVRYHAGAMLSAVAEGRVPWPEWAVRLPIFLFAVVAVYLLYRAVASAFGRRAGLLGGLVLVTMPQWFLLTHQTMTDMPFVAPMAASMALFLLGAHADPERVAKVYEVEAFGRRVRLSAYHVVLGAVVACALPQILYLLSRNVDIRFDPFDVRTHLDAFSSGSPGNCGLPGNEACKPFTPVLRGLHPALQALIWIQALALLLYVNWGERRVQRLCFLAAWLFAAISTMAKGPAGVGLPVLCALAYVAVSKRLRDLTRMEIASGLLVLAAVALPWFVAMYARHGQPFTDRLFFHDMYKRAFVHVHDTNEGDDVSFRYYVWQLGYAMFPWVGLAPAALAGWVRRREGTAKADATALLGTWFVFGFALFSLMLTKFHHYILPVVPAAAMLVGVLLDEFLDAPDAAAATEAVADDDGPPPSPAVYYGGAVASTLFTALGLAKMLGARGALVGAHGALDVGAFAKAAWVGVGLTVLGAAGLVLTVLYAGRAPWLARASGDAPPSSRPSHAGRAYAAAALGACAVAGALVVLVVGRDLAGSAEGLPSQIRFVHLFSYNYKRPWPASLDFSGAFWAATVLGAALTLSLAWPRVRRHAVVGLVSFGLVFAAWGLDVYFMKVSPHWGQRETTLAYYRAIQTKPGPLIAYQMNWKGENFYTGNHVPAFTNTGKKFSDFILEEKRKGAKTFYFVAEHGRTTALANEIGNPRVFNRLTTAELNNKFVLVQAIFE